VRFKATTSRHVCLTLPRLNAGHTLADKHALIKLVQQNGIQHQLVAVFARQKRVDDQLAKQLQKMSLEPDGGQYAGQHFYGFAEFHVPKGTKGVNAELPIMLESAKEYQMVNLVIELDACCERLNENIDTTLAVLASRLAWVRENLGGTCFINVRDYVTAFETPELEFLERLTHFLANMPSAQRISGLCMEDPSGGVLPDLLGAYVAHTRRIFNEAGWTDAHILVHIHQGYGLAEACVLEALACGGTGIWCGISREGAGTGHANSLTTITNLVRLGNKDTASRFNLASLRAAAIEATKVCTGELPHPLTELYGSRSLDVCFDGGGMGGGGGFDPAAELAVKTKIRVSTMTTPFLFGEKMSEVFGAESAPEGGWPEEVRKQMWANVNRDLCRGVKEEYDSAPAIFALYTRSGGAATPAMTEICSAEIASAAHPAVRAFQASWQAAFGDALEVEPDDFFVRCCARFFFSPSSPLFLSLASLLDGDYNDGVISVSLSMARTRFAWAARSYPDECDGGLDDAWVCLIKRLAEPRMLERARKLRVQKTLKTVRRALTVGGGGLLARIKKQQEQEESVALPGDLSAPSSGVTRLSVTR